MLLPSIEKIYNDAMVLEGLYDITDHLILTELSDALTMWDGISAQISDLIPRVAIIDTGEADDLLKCWRAVREETEDFRRFGSIMETALIPGLMHALNILYNPISIKGTGWVIEKSPAGFLTIQNAVSGHFIHSPVDPMREASILARHLYRPQMDSFHILGCGLGYLPYQIWERSDRTAHIYIYEDDDEMLQYADQMGVLSWINEDDLTIVSPDDTQTMLKRFIDAQESETCGRYVSDWKSGHYRDSIRGEYIDAMDYNARTALRFESIRQINIRENKKGCPFEIDALKDIYSFTGLEYIVVSAGPSLNDCIDFLKDSVRSRVIIAVNTTLKRLISEEIYPNICVMLDPTSYLARHIEGIEEYTEEIPLVFPINGNHAFVSAYRGPKYIVGSSDKSTAGFEWNYGGTVASLGLDVAYYLEASKIYLVGSDLAFTGGNNYADSTVHISKSEKYGNISVKASDGGIVETKQIYNVYREILEGQIARHPNVPVINMARHGAFIKGTVLPD